ncbi:MAG: hypothetical protein AAFR96_07730 [Planctomycetota bacterium]
METLFGFDDLAPATPPATASGPPPSAPGDRETLIDRIIELNPTATAAFLGQFTSEQLALYLDHLLIGQQPRGRDAVWQRSGETPAIVESRSAA